MSHKEQKCDSLLKKHEQISVPQYVLIYTIDVVGKVCVVVYFLGKEDRKIILFKFCHCLAFNFCPAIFCSARELFRYLELEKLCLLADFMASIGYIFYSKTLLIREHPSDSRKFKKRLYTT